MYIYILLYTYIVLLIYNYWQFYKIIEIKLVILNNNSIDLNNIISDLVYKLNITKNDISILHKTEDKQIDSYFDVINYIKHNKTIYNNITQRLEIKLKFSNKNRNLLKISDKCINSDYKNNYNIYYIYLKLPTKNKYIIIWNHIRLIFIRSILRFNILEKYIPNNCFTILSINEFNK